MSEKKSRALRYAESCDNQSGSFLSHHLVDIRKNAFTQGFNEAILKVKELEAVIDFWKERIRLSEDVVFNLEEYIREDGAISIDKTNNSLLKYKSEYFN